jgi:AcrR family transcriptional regulator
MVTLSRKQREIKEREGQILKLARPILLRKGYQALSMDRLAAQMEYAKGTLYTHFRNKEEIVLALAAESMELRLKMFEAASAASRVSRERLIAIGAACELYTQEYADHFRIEDWIRNSTIWGKASRERQDLVRQCEGRCMSIVAGIVRDAVAHGDLKLENDLTAEEMIFGFWAINYGSQVLAATSPSLLSLGVPNAPRAIRHHCFTLLNGFGWLPNGDFASHNETMDRFGDLLRKQFAAQLTDS